MSYQTRFWTCAIVDFSVHIILVYRMWAFSGTGINSILNNWLPQAYIFGPAKGERRIGIILRVDFIWLGVYGFKGWLNSWIEPSRVLSSPKVTQPLPVKEKLFFVQSQFIHLSCQNGFTSNCLTEKILNYF